MKGTLLFEAIAEKENIQATDEDVEKKHRRVCAEETGQAARTGEEALQGRRRSAEGLSLRLREEKTIEFLKASAKYS